jgi:hypothetical protein
MNQKTLDLPVRNAEPGAVRRWLKRAILLVATLALAGQCVAAEKHDTIVILLDASGSMKAAFQGTRGSRMDAAKSALKTVISKVPETTRVGLLVFSAANLTNDWAFPLGPRDDAQLFAKLDSIECRTDTPLGKYIKMAADRLLDERAKNFGYGTYRLIIVTDGEAQDQNLVERYTPEVIARGITVDVIGVGMKTAHTLARKVHSYRGANDSKALDQALGEVFAEVHDTKKDAAGSEVFALIAPLSNDAASALIQAVASAPNQPIGEPGAAPAGIAAPAALMQQPAQPTPPAATPPQTQHYREKKFRVNWIMIVIGLVVISSIRKAFRGGGRRR